jgi:PTH1 family peptidyl-tRNA hydrolase
MKVIVGLGNIGERYEKTRHNIGFIVVDYLAERLGISFNNSPKHFSFVAKNKDYILVKPQTFMNESGKAIRAICDYFNINVEEDLIVAHDDLDIEVGQFKRQQGRGPKVHNGLASTYQYLGTNNFLHMRIGIDGRNGDRSIPGSNYVLSNFSQEESKKIKDVIEYIGQELLT